MNDQFIDHPTQGKNFHVKTHEWLPQAVKNLAINCLFISIICI